MMRHWSLVVKACLALTVLTAAPAWSLAQRPPGVAGGFGPGPGGFGRGGINPFLGLYLPYPGGYNYGYGYGGYDPIVASVPSTAYFTYGGTSYTTTSPSPLPVYNPQGAYSPLPPPLALTSLLQVHVPIDAEVWLEGQKMRSIGAVRRYRTPPLNPAKGYVYEVRVRWPADGKMVEDIRHTSIRAGATVHVDFTQPELPVPRPAGNPPTPTKRPAAPAGTPPATEPTPSAPAGPAPVPGAPSVAATGAR